jgi:hypothetical protein
MWFFSIENHTQLIEVTTLDRKSGGAEGSAVSLDRASNAEEKQRLQRDTSSGDAD